MKIEMVEAFPLKFPLGEDAYGSSRGIVPARETTLVKVVTVEGAVGWGECFGPVHAISVLVAEIAEAIVGKEYVSPVTMVNTLSLQNYHRGLGIYTAALSGVEIALWDAMGRELDRSVADLLGGRANETVTPYASAGYAKNDRDIDKFYLQLMTHAEGFAGAKIKCGFGVDEDVARAQAARKALGSGKPLMVDINGSYTADIAIRSINKLKDLGITWIEEPLPPQDIQGLKQLRKLGVPIATGEALYTRYPFLELISQHLVDIVQPDVTKVGGLYEAKIIAEIARSWGIRFSPHVWGGGIALAAALQLMSAVPLSPHVNTAPEPFWLELDRGRNELRDGMLQQPIEVHNGQIHVPTGPGLGVEVNEAALQSWRVDL